MSTKRRVCEKKPAEPPPPRKNPNEKLIQAETTEMGTVWFDSSLPFSTLTLSVSKKILFIPTLDAVLLNVLHKSRLQALGVNLAASDHSDVGLWQRFLCLARATYFGKKKKK